MKVLWSGVAGVVLLTVCYQNMQHITKLGGCVIWRVSYHSKFTLASLGTKIFHGSDNLETDAKSFYELKADDIRGNELSFDKFKDRVCLFD